MNITDNKKISYLIIGYGNTIRGDDGAGYQIAEAVAEWNLNHVRCRRRCYCTSLAVHQLTPDLAEAIAQAKTVIFVDAVATLSEVKIEQLRPNYAASFTGHYTDPRSMLAITYALYEAIPIAYRILIPAVDFSFSETLSPVTQKSVDLALVKIKQLVSQQNSRMSTAYEKSQSTQKESYMKTSDRSSHPISLEQRIHDAIAEAHAISAQYGSQSRKSAAAWDIVEELQAEAAHQQAKHSGTTAFTDYCEEFPDAPEARADDT